MNQLKAPVNPDTDDFSVEDDLEATNTLHEASRGEYGRLIAKLKYQDRRARILFKRGIGKDERKRLKAKYGN